MMLHIKPCLHKSLETSQLLKNIDPLSVWQKFHKIIKNHNRIAMVWGIPFFTLHICISYAVDKINIKIKFLLIQPLNSKLHDGKTWLGRLKGKQHGMFKDTFIK